MVLDQFVTDRYALYNADSALFMAGLPGDVIHFTIYSPPFAGLYNYSSDPRDLSNCLDYKEFYDHYRVFVEQIHRITMPGRLSAVHCAEIPSGNSGTDHMFDLPGDIVRLHESLGFKYIGRHVIWKESLWVRNRTMAHNLTHQTIVDDAADAGLAAADYLLLFRKSGENPIPIEHPAGLLDYAGECPIPGDLIKYRGWTGKQTENLWSHQIWRRYASSIWDDIRMQRVLPYQDCKEADDEKHVHPLQRDIVERAVVLRTNPGETVLTPFMGVGSEVFDPVRLGRKAIGIELKPAYYRQAVANLATVDNPEVEQTTFSFDMDLDAVTP